MPDYYEGLPGTRPPEKDQMAKAQDEHEQKQIDRKAAAENNLDKTKESGPAERMYGQDRFVNTHGGTSPERAKPRTELTPAQEAMKAKREEARKLDKAELSKPYSDRVIGRLPEKSPGRGH